MKLNDIPMSTYAHVIIEGHSDLIHQDLTFAEDDETAEQLVERTAKLHSSKLGKLLDNNFQKMNLRGKSFSAILFSRGIILVTEHSSPPDGSEKTSILSIAEMFFIHDSIHVKDELIHLSNNE